MSIENEEQNAVNQIYEYAANLMVNEKKSALETQNALLEQGLDEETASIVVSNLEQEIEKAKKERANKDMLYGALWCVGGFIATAADTGYIFWGAIVFGAIQFFKGLLSL
jgi:hypothetical protein